MQMMLGQWNIWERKSIWTNILYYRITLNLYALGHGTKNSFLENVPDYLWTGNGSKNKALSLLLLLLL